MPTALKDTTLEQDQAVPPSAQAAWNAVIREIAVQLYQATAIADKTVEHVSDFSSLSKASQHVFINAARCTVHRLNTVNHRLALSQAQAVATESNSFCEGLDAYFATLALPISTLRYRR